MTARERIEALLRGALVGADAGEAVRRALRMEGSTLRVADGHAVDLSEVGRVLLVGAGKAAIPMARAAVEVLGGAVAAGTITTTAGGAGAVWEGVEVWEAGHPLPDAHGLAASAETLRLLRSAGADDLVVCLLSGGASALWSAPPEGVSLGDLRRVTSGLLRSGAPIGELNTLRRHLSRIAGGRLARAAAPARVLTLALSDVVGEPPEAIGSGPTLPDPTTFADATEVLRRRGIHAPSAVLRHLQAGMAGEAQESAKPGELHNLLGFHVVAGIGDALAGAAAEAERLGFAARIVSESLQGEAREVGAEVARAALRARDEGAGPLALFWGGETTVTVRGDGRGGRSQELALAAALVLEGEAGVAVGSFGTDGRDGPTDAAGAAVDGGTVGRGAGADAREALERNDAHTFLKAAGDLLVTGPTGTNVGDVVVALVGD